MSTNAILDSAGNGTGVAVGGMADGVPVGSAGGLGVCAGGVWAGGGVCAGGGVWANAALESAIRNTVGNVMRVIRVGPPAARTSSQSILFGRAGSASRLPAIEPTRS